MGKISLPGRIITGFGSTAPVAHAEEHIISALWMQTNSEQQVIVAEGFTAAAYDPENKFGMLSVAYNYDNCGSSEPLEIGLMIFGESVPVLGSDGPIAGEIGFKKFEKITAYGLGFIPAGNLFTVYGDEGLQIYLLQGSVWVQ